MTTRITIPAAEVRIGDQFYDGPAVSAHPTFAWEAITRINVVDGLIELITGNLDTPHGEFWFEPDETVTVVRHPPVEPEQPVAKPHGKRGHGHSG
ncbi:MAG TPA: hypothetical protein VFF82_07725 [Rhodocyclaceae bacterium]|nr:hypothetical protein [Rhodocyclaceae bacterium]